MESKRTASELLKFIEENYKSEHHYASVDLSDFSHVDKRFYQKESEQFTKHQFIHVEDCEDLTISNAQDRTLKRVPIRVMVSQDGTVMVGIYHPKIRSIFLRILLFIIRQRLGKIIDLETEFEDGSFVVTSNAMAASPMSLPKLISCEYLPKNTKAEDLLKIHTQRVSDHSQIHKARPRFSKTIEEIRASQNRMNALKAAFRSEIGGITEEELIMLSPSVSVAEEVFDEITTINKKKIANQGSPYHSNQSLCD